MFQIENIRRFHIFASKHALTGAVVSAGVIHLYLLVVALDSMFFFTIGATTGSPVVRLVVFGFIFGALVIKLSERVTFDAFVLVLIAYLAFGFVGGIALDYSPYILFRQAFAATTMLTSYWIGLYLAENIRAIERPLRIFAWLTFAGVIAFLLVAVAYGVLGRPNTSVSVGGPLLLSLDMAIRSGPWWLLLACIAIVLVTNSRNILMATSVILGAVVAQRFFSRRNLVIRIATAAVVAVAIFAVLTITIVTGARYGADYGFMFGERSLTVVEAVDKIGEPSSPPLKSTDITPGTSKELIESERASVPGPPGAQGGHAPKEPIAPAPKRDAADPSEGKDSLEAFRISDRVDFWDQFTSGRITQTIGAYDAINRNVFSMIFGPGFGAEYVWRYISRASNTEQIYIMHQAEFMPAHFLLTGGFFFAIAIISLIIWNLIKIFSAACGSYRTLGMLFVIGFAFNMFLAFQPNTPLFWMLLAAFGKAYSLRRRHVSPSAQYKQQRI